MSKRPIGIIAVILVIVGVGGCLVSKPSPELQSTTSSTTISPTTTKTSLPSLDTAEEVINKIKKSYSGLDNFIATVESYKGQKDQTREEMDFQNKFKLYFQLEGGKSYTELIKKGKQLVITTSEPLRVIGKIEEYEGIKLVGEEELEGRSTYLLEWKGSSDGSGPSPGWKMWIEKNKWVVLRQDIYSGTKIGIRSWYTYKKVGNYWLPATTKSEMPATGKVTFNTRNNYQINTEFPEEIIEKLR